MGNDLGLEQLYSLKPAKVFISPADPTSTVDVNGKLVYSTASSNLFIFQCNSGEFGSGSWVTFSGGSTVDLSNYVTTEGISLTDSSLGGIGLFEHTGNIGIQNNAVDGVINIISDGGIGIADNSGNGISISESLIGPFGISIGDSGGGGILLEESTVGGNYGIQLSALNGSDFEIDSSGGLYATDSSTNGIELTASNAAATISLQGMFELVTHYAFTDLPTPVLGMVAIVTDSPVVTWGTPITTGGGVSGPVLAWYNGTNWTVLGA